MEGVLALPNNTWVLSKEENHWTMTSVHDAVFTNNIHYNTLLTCISVDRLNLSYRFCIGPKRPRSTFHIVDNSHDSVKECFTFVDCIKTSSSDCNPICVVSWCHDDFSKCLRDVDAIECNNENEYIGKIKLLSLYDAMKHMPTDVKFINQTKPIIMNKMCSCCKSDVNGAVHVCGRIDTSESMT